MQLFGTLAVAALVIFFGRRILKRLRRIHMNLDDLLTKVQAQTTVIDSAKTLLETLSAEIKAAGTDPAKLQAISDALDANTTELSAAVQANTQPTA